MSYDHKPVNKGENSRIVAAGGFVEFGRVNGAHSPVAASLTAQATSPSRARSATSSSSRTRACRPSSRS